MITTAIIKKICPYAKLVNINNFVPYLNELMPKYEIDTVIRIRHFISQLAHESGSFNYVEEIASGKAYEFRKSLGNINEGDGVKFKGRGLIQITGRNNYKKLSEDIGVDFISNPELLKTPKYAVESACWYWKKANLNSSADIDDIKGVTKKINGGYNGLQNRINFYNLAKLYIV